MAKKMVTILIASFLLTCATFALAQDRKSDDPQAKSRQKQMQKADTDQPNDQIQDDNKEARQSGKQQRIQDRHRRGQRPDGYKQFRQKENRKEKIYQKCRRMMQKGRMHQGRKQMWSRQGRPMQGFDQMCYGQIGSMPRGFDHPQLDRCPRCGYMSRPMMGFDKGMYGRFQRSYPHMRFDQKRFRGNDFNSRWQDQDRPMKKFDRPRDRQKPGYQESPKMRQPRDD